MGDRLPSEPELADELGVSREHREIVNAIAAKDKKRAKKAVSDHLTRVRENIKGI